jgi:hypothetical protein
MSTDDIKRLYFYERQFLGARDFREEQGYHIEMRRRHLVAHHRWGIVAGLSITQDANSKVWAVEPGMAVDAYGREILVFDPEPLNTEQIAARLAGEVKPVQLKIWLAYKTEKAQKPAPGYRACDEKDGFMRVRETFRLIYQDDPVFDLHQTADPANQDPNNQESWPRAFQDLPDDPKQARWPIFLGTLVWDTDPDNPLQNAVISVSALDSRDGQRRRYVGVVAAEIISPDKRLLIRGLNNKSPLPENDSGVQVELEGRLDVHRRLVAERDIHVHGGIRIGSGLTPPVAPLHITAGKDASLDPEAGYVLLGSVDAPNIVLDNNEIMARDDGKFSSLHLQAEGGDLIVHHVQADSRVIFKDGGGVGIGTTQPDQALTISRTGSAYLNVKSNNGAHEVLLGSDGNGGIVSTMTNHDLQLRAGGNSTKLTIKKDGNVGIGTTNPNRLLTLRSEDNAYLNIRANGGAHEVLIGADGNGGIISTMSAHDLLLRAGGNDTKMIIKAGGNVGIGLETPITPLHVQANKSGTATPPHHIAFIENTAASNSDVLGLKVGRLLPDGTNNFITFFDSNNGSLGSIQGNGVGGVVFGAAGSDYAEWLPRLEEQEQIEAGDIVGVFGGRVSLQTTGAQHIMAISSQPIVLGNMPEPAAQHLYERVAFLGQAPVKVRGLVRAGDYIVPSGLDDGTGIAITPHAMTLAHYQQIVGRAWETSNQDGVRKINVAVGLESNYAEAGLTALLLAQQEELKALRAELDNLKSVSEQG